MKLVYHVAARAKLVMLMSTGSSINVGVQVAADDAQQGNDHANGDAHQALALVQFRESLKLDEYLSENASKAQVFFALKCQGLI